MNAKAHVIHVWSGLIVAGGLASVLSAILMVGSMMFFAPQSMWISATNGGFVGTALILSLIGLPFAWMTTFAIGAPLWWLLARRRPLTHAQAASIGAIAGVIIVAIETAFVLGYLSSWTMVHKHVFDATCTVGIGIICGVVANVVAGPARAQAQPTG